MAKKGYGATIHPLGFRSATPLPDPAELARFYAELYYQTPQTSTYQTSYPQLELDHRAARARLLFHALGEVTQNRIKGARLLEVGVGEGFILKAAIAAGFDARGIDFSDFGLNKFHPELRSRLVVGDALAVVDELANTSEQFDVCILQNVLEHVIDPFRLMAGVRAILAQGGVAAITVPNDFSKLQALATELGHIESEFWFAPPQHLHYFNTESIQPFMEENGFTVIDFFCDFPIDLYLMHPGSNYVRDKSLGPAAHQARMHAELLMQAAGLDPHLRLCRALAGCGLGRDLTVIVEPA